MILELNDWQLTTRNNAGSEIASEPAAASDANGELIFGAPAQSLSRQSPQQYNNRYLYTLAPEPLPRDLGPARNQADLIYHHLRSLNLTDNDGLLIGVGGHVTNEQLGLLLGIAQELQIPVRGFIDNALAYGLDAPASSSFHVIDIELHRLLISKVEVTSQQRSISHCAAIDGAGMAAILEGWMNVIADDFVHKTRFDPLHAAASEQQLFDTVSNWLGQSTLTDQRIRINHGESIRELEVSAGELSDKLSQRLSAVDFTQLGTIGVTERVMAVPFLSDLLASRVDAVLPLESASAGRNFSQLGEGLATDQVRRVTSGSSSLMSDLPATTAAADTDLQSATHLLQEHIAFAFDHPAVSDYIDAATGSATGESVTINGRPSHGGPLKPGDTVALGAQLYTAIRLE